MNELIRSIRISMQNMRIDSCHSTLNEYKNFEKSITSFQLEFSLRKKLLRAKASSRYRKHFSVSSVRLNPVSRSNFWSSSIRFESKRRLASPRTLTRDSQIKLFNSPVSRVKRAFVIDIVQSDGERFLSNYLAVDRNFYHCMLSDSFSRVLARLTSNLTR